MENSGGEKHEMRSYFNQQDLTKVQHSLTMDSLTYSYTGTNLEWLNAHMKEY